jgi:hypothetical protein
VRKRVTIGLAGIILGIAGFLFVVDVVSPATPIPQAQMQEIRSGLIVLLFITRLIVWRFRSVVVSASFLGPVFHPRLPSRDLMARLCILLC